MATDVEDRIIILFLDVGELDGVGPEVLVLQEGGRDGIFGEHGDRTGI